MGRDGSGGRAFRGVEAVVDKDRTAALLAELVKADALVILTEVARVQQDFGTPRARELGTLTVREARRMLAAGQLPEGSMGPKVEACAAFAEFGGRAVIGALDDVVEIVFGAAGTTVVP